MTCRMNTNNIGRIAIIVLTILSIFIACASAQESKILVSTSRQIILDDPSGWVNAGWGAQTARGNQMLGDETAIRWYALVIDSNGTALPGISVTSQLRFPNGTVQYTDTKTTDSNGLAEFFRDLDNINQRPYLATSTEGYWQIDVSTAGGLSSNARFIYDEIGCGKSGSACHKSQDWQPLTGISTKNLSNSGSFISVSKNSPYVQKRDKIHGAQDGHGHVVPLDGLQILSGECMTCHKSYNGTYTATSTRQYFDPQYPLGVHQGKVNCTQCHGIYDTSGVEVPDMPVKKCYDCHPLKNDNLTSMTYTQNDIKSYSYLPLTSSEINGHNQNIPCITCHNNGHNVTKPLLDGTSNKITEYQQCLTCHSSYEKHNTGLDCTVCHSQDIHQIKIFSQSGNYIIGKDNPVRGNCTNCHENPTFLSILLGQPKAGNYIGSAPQIPDFRHSGQVGDKWNRTGDPVFWTNPYTACKYCHGDTKHNNTAFGKPNSFKGTNVIGTYGTWCGGCHYQGDSMWNTMLGIMGLIPPEITGHTTYGSYGSKYFNHNTIGGFEDTKCKKCHGNKPEVTSLMHQVSPGGGGPDCVACHDAPLGGDLPHVDVSSMNGVNSIHKDLNKDAPSTVSSDNKRCWSCHGNGTEPDKHPDNYKNPAKCIDCHAGSNRNFTPSYSIKVVSEHYWNGEQIITSGVSTCYQCHNKSEMMIAANDPDVGSGDVYGGANGGNNSTSHYGKKRNDLVDGTSNYCNYCHNATISPGSFFDIFVDNYNKNIANHSRYGTNPKCQDCHGNSRIHDSALDFTVLALPTSTICLGCHGPGGTASIKDKEKHNGTVECSLCHLQDGKDIHPIKYLNNTGGFALSQTEGVKCDKCHESGQYGAPAIGKIGHSTNSWNGSLWNAGRPSIFWDNRTLSTACDYCHGNSKHNISAIGKANLYKGTNTKNVFGDWCGICHYQGNGQYRNMISIMNPLIAPEISKNATYGNYVQARDGTIYYNHSLTTYGDDECKYCHYSGIPSNLTSLMHGVEIGGTSCIGCHSIPGTNYLIDTASLGRHNNVSRSEGLGIVTDNDCKGCHFNVLTIDQMVQGYANKSNTYFCGDCHTSTGRQSGTQYPLIPTNLRVDTFKHANSSCETCHIAGDDEILTIMQQNKYHPNGPKGNAVGKNCYSCHYRTDGAQYPVNGATIGLNDPPFNAPGEDHKCDLCHPSVNKRPTLTGTDSCAACHGLNHSVTIGGHSDITLQIYGVTVDTPVSSGSIANVTGTITNNFVQVAKAQYKIMKGTVVIKDWTNMTATDGKFNGRFENVKGSIDTTGMSGTYNVQVRGMISGNYIDTGTNHDPNRPYYPDNGVWTETVTVTMDVTAGTYTIGLYQISTGVFYLKNNNNPGPADFMPQYGWGGNDLLPLVGDWDGDGDDTIGLYQISTGMFYLKNNNNPGPADFMPQYGWGGNDLLPLVGDWDGDGDDTIGLYQISTGMFYLKNNNNPGPADFMPQYGWGGNDLLPLVGDWDGV